MMSFAIKGKDPSYSYIPGLCYLPFTLKVSLLAIESKSQNRMQTADEHLFLSVVFLTSYRHE